MFNRSVFKLVVIFGDDKILLCIGNPIYNRRWQHPIHCGMHVCVTSGARVCSYAYAPSYRYRMDYG